VREEARDELPQALRAAGVPVTRLVLYRSERIPEAELLALPRGEFDYACSRARPAPRPSSRCASGRASRAPSRSGARPPSPRAARRLRPCLPATPTTNDLIEAMVPAMIERPRRLRRSPVLREPSPRRDSRALT
jgi:hypothetical protein